MFYNELTSQIKCIQALIQQNEIIPEIAKNLDASHFLDPNLRDIYEWLISENHKPSDFETPSNLENYLIKNHKNLKENDLINTIFSKTEILPPAFELAELVKFHSLQSQYKFLITEENKNLSNMNSNIVENLSTLRENIDNIISQTIVSDEKNFKEEMQDFLKVIKSKDDNLSIKSPFSQVDYYTRRI